jgi:hypothetical protein
VNNVFFFMLDEGTKTGMDDAFWLAGCAAAVEDIG